MSPRRGSFTLAFPSPPLPLFKIPPNPSVSRVILISKTRDWVAWIPVFSSTTPAMQERESTRAREVEVERESAHERAREQDRKSEEEENAAPEKGRVKNE